jgi:hypothetical protein
MKIHLVAALAVIASAADISAASPASGMVAKDVDVIAACVGGSRELDHCVVVCDMRSSEPIVCAQSAHIDAVNDAIRRRWPQGCEDSRVQPRLISPVEWSGPRAATVLFGIPAGPAGPLGCHAKRRTFGGWSVKFGIRE